MQDTLLRYLSDFHDQLSKRAIRVPLETLCDRYSTQNLTSAGLVINAGGATFAKTGAADTYFVVKGILQKIAAGTAMPALTGINAGAGQFVVAAFFLDGSGNITVAGGNPGATLGAATFPAFPQGKALIGFLIITYASAFTGGTTPLDTATTVYINADGPLDPAALTGL